MRLPFSICLHFGHVLLVLRGSTRSDPGSFGQVHGNEQKPLAVFAADKIRFSFCQTEPFALIFAHHERLSYGIAALERKVGKTLLSRL
jgi:hypothetical protein